jgi:hypothetical protein
VPETRNQLRDPNDRQMRSHLMAAAIDVLEASVRCGSACYSRSLLHYLTVTRLRLDRAFEGCARAKPRRALSSGGCLCRTVGFRPLDFSACFALAIPSWPLPVTQDVTLDALIATSDLYRGRIRWTDQCFHCQSALPSRPLASSSLTRTASGLGYGCGRGDGRLLLHLGTGD